MTYKAAIIQSDQMNLLVEKPQLHAGPGELIVRVHGCFICGSDLKTLKFGNPRISDDRIMGHEIAGTVVEVGTGVGRFQMGDRVALGADFPCFECESCAQQNYRGCTAHMAIGHEYDGGFAEFIKVPPSFVKEGPVIKVNDETPLRLAGLSEPVACCLRGFNERFFPASVTNLCILGAGPIGSIIATIARVKMPNARIIFIEPNDVRRKHLESLGVGDRWFAKATALLADMRPDLVFVACSVPEAQRDAVELVRNGGTVCMFGGVPKALNKPMIDSNLVHYKELCVYGTTGSDKRDVSKALELISRNKTAFERLISCEFSLDEIGDAVAVAQSGTELKVFIKCE
ncbi:alcohol dehydrogenase catalytic domain-containing protein [Alphaproteobacteria bacterium]|nr:alcohol dehydrogenase catalytic domain-containing protein [Alphaproteobacteria bacterium]